jgi:23S rRNA (cytidine1920-2'-O)/16S rRNA (cytidine1409-2'-O)-methyltransferase
VKKRLDQYLQEAGYFESRSRAQAAVMEGTVSVDGRTDVKPGTQVTGAEDIKVTEGASRYVSRGGFKLAGALAEYGVDVRGMTVIDVGSSTGGFTDCLLQAGASGIIAVDVGKGQLHARLRGDERVTVLEGVNARELDAVELPMRPDLAVIDVSFISLEKVLEPVSRALAAGGSMLALVKPQFEAGVGKAPKGVVRDPAVHLEVLGGLAVWLKEKGFALRGVTASCLKGPKGNVEFFMLIDRGSGEGVGAGEIAGAVRRAGSM